jgi:hypothetical protein
VVFFLLAYAVFDCLAFIALALPPLWANIIFFGTVLAGLASILWLERQAGHRPGRGPG